MVADTVRRRSAVDGLQPLSLARDWRQVVDLIEVAFGDSLDAEAQRALRSMRLPPLLAPLIGLLDSLSAPGDGMMPGFVWLAGGRVVGTASVRRINAFNRGWLISNVAVHPDWQGRGIGRTLVEAAIDFAEEHRGAWIALQVRDVNLVALRLYESAGFRPISEVTRLQKPAANATLSAGIPEGFRPARWSDGRALARLARSSTPYDVLWADILSRDLYKTGPLSRRVARLRGRQRRWWVQDALRRPRGHPDRNGFLPGSALSAAMGVDVDAQLPWQRLRLLFASKAQDEQLAARLIDFGLSQLVDSRQLPVVVEHPASDEIIQAGLVAAGFTPVYASIHMRLNLRDLRKTRGV